MKNGSEAHTKGNACHGTQWTQNTFNLHKCAIYFIFFFFRNRKHTTAPNVCCTQLLAWLKFQLVCMIRVSLHTNLQVYSWLFSNLFFDILTSFFSFSHSFVNSTAIGVSFFSIINLNIHFIWEKRKEPSPKWFTCVNMKVKKIRFIYVDLKLVYMFMIMINADHSETYKTVTL